MNVDPEKRYNVEQIKNHPLFNKISLNTDKGYIIGKDEILFDIEIIEKIKNILKDQDLSTEKILRNLRKNSHNNTTTT